MTAAEEKRYKAKLDHLLAHQERPLKEIIDRMLSYNLSRRDIGQVLQLAERHMVLAEDGQERHIPALNFRNALCCYLAFDERSKKYAKGEELNSYD